MKHQQRAGLGGWDARPDDCWELVAEPGCDESEGHA